VIEGSLYTCYFFVMDSKDHQNFSLQGNLVTYELPINEKARNFLRMEHFTSRIDNYLSGQKLDDECLTVGLLIALSDFINRSDLRKNLITGLDGAAIAFNDFFGNPQVDMSNLERVVDTIKDNLAILRSPDYNPGLSVKNDQLIHQVRQKTSYQGAINISDLPRFYFWTQQSHSEKASQIERWMSDILPLKRANELMLEIIRGSLETSFEMATQGFFQRTLSKDKVNYLLRFSLPISLSVFPETSGGKQRFTVRFFHHCDTNSKPKQTSDEIQFQLQICGI
jgi:cell division protein ZapD